MITQPPEVHQRDKRRDLIRRAQVGGTGLVLVMLLVGLSTLLTGEAREDAAAATARAEAAGAPLPAAPPEDPLANLGVERSSTAPSPRATPDARVGAPTTPLPAPGPVVPDLQPDPRLQRSAPR
jgi:hypothetical protein